MNIRVLAATTLCAAAAVALVGCSPGQPVASSSGATTSSPAAPTREVTPPTDIKSSDAVCEDGTATVTPNNEKITVPDCEKVVVKASNSIVELGTVTDLTIAGSLNLVTTSADVKRISVQGDANSVETGGSPQVTDSGKQNEISK